MLHTKTTSPDMTSNWQSKCPRKEDAKSKSTCSVGIPSAEILGRHSTSLKDDKVDAGARNLYEPNCYRHTKVMELVPELEKAIRLLKSKNLN